MTSSAHLLRARTGDELALGLVRLVDVDVLVRDELGERVGDPLEQRVEALLREHVVEDLGQPAVRLGGAGRDEAHVGPRSRLDGSRVGHAASKTSSDARGAGLRPPLRRSAGDGDPDDARHAAALPADRPRAARSRRRRWPLAEALAEDARAAGEPVAFMLARFVWPASRLAELPDPGRAVQRRCSTGRFRPGLEVEAVEARYRDDLDALAGLADEVYVEVPTRRCARRAARRARRARTSARRCAAVARRLPASATSPAFVRACRERDLVFKATAGLHHAVRTNGEHGFLNLLAAVVFGDEEAALAEDDAAAFALDADVVPVARSLGARRRSSRATRRRAASTRSGAAASSSRSRSSRRSGCSPL